MMLLNKLDFETVLRNKHISIFDVESAGLKPSRVFMNTNTYHSLIGIFHQQVIMVIPEGRRRSCTIYGVKIAISDDLDDYEVEVSARY